MTWTNVCSTADLIPNAGIALRLGASRIALFYLPDEQPMFYAVDHYDPIGRAPVIARGIVGDLHGELVVASPLYKHHFRLRDGRCLENPKVELRTWRIRQDGAQILIADDAQAAA